MAEHISEDQHEDGGPGPNLRRRELGRELRKLREQAGKKTADAAKYAGLTVTTINRLESGKQVILPRNVRLLCQFYGVEAPYSDTLVRQAEESNERGWWAMYSDNMPDWFEKFVGLESDAEELWNYSPLIIDGLLQTSEYAQALFEAGTDSSQECALARAVELRRARQEGVNRDKHPTKLHVVLDEAALHRVVGGEEVLRDQLHHLSEVSIKPNMAIQVMPFSAGAHLGLQTPFSMLRFPEGYDDMDAVYIENQRGAVWLERPTDIERYTRVFTEMQAAALSADDSRKLVDSLASSL
ncbi:transcriptional regulator with XRE-family HTH domain [Saccharopolyspora lacisalsi]|uniref:Transcriptional regulator with XRE-family HTH domain n=1 Tax=Halosaccharopolyspora lacisalsi TaxID=1000566 RepID=A0A839E675_9PSEU|nr:Scr1 family TA system antitoxin-like transcriptional regulator [Halosaccharopolyspora lacisalsi]MBA8827217.1 transcriptional regulator with XRE-family HTH domain [Halosaccharopolyspora lacisalsi]